MHPACKTVLFSAAILFCTATLFQTARSLRAADKPATSKIAISGADSPTATVDFKPRKPAELRTAVSNELRAAAAAKEPSERDKSVRQLMLVYLELEQDKNLTHDERLELHTEVRSRLSSIEKSMRAEIARQNPATKTDIAAKTKSNAADEINGPVNDVAVLAQQIARPAIAPQAGAAGGLAAGPGALANPVIANGGVIGRLQPPDYGQNLVDLIHNVIAPRTWDVNGGPGSVVYFRNFRALVVRAPSEVQTQVGDVLGQLRK
jgi:hypothetical protein